MDEITVSKYLLAQTEQEIDYFNQYQNMRSDDCWVAPTPSKMKIKDNLKMIRRVALDLYNQY